MSAKWISVSTLIRVRRAKFRERDFTVLVNSSMQIVLKCYISPEEYFIAVTNSDKNCCRDSGSFCL